LYHFFALVLISESLIPVRDRIVPPNTGKSKVRTEFCYKKCKRWFDDEHEHEHEHDDYVRKKNKMTKKIQTKNKTKTRKMSSCSINVSISLTKKLIQTMKCYVLYWMVTG
jgi:hypothetical protein